MRSLRICQVSAAYYPYPSGVTEYVHHLALALHNRGHQVTVLTTRYSKSFVGQSNGSGAFEVVRLGRAWLLPMNKSFATVPLGWRLSAQVKEFLKTGRFDIVHLHGIFPPDISFWALSHSRAVNLVTFHTVGFGTSKVAASLCRALFSRQNNKLAGKIAVTRDALDFIQPYFPGRFRIIREGVDTNRFRPDVQSIPDLGPDGRTILFVGRLDRRKGLEVLIRALPFVRQHLASARLVVVGKGPLDNDCRRLVRELGLDDAVVFVGYVPGEQLPRYYTSADVYCAPTLGGEAFGIVLLEAMASGIPVVATHITGYREVVTDGETGMLVRPNDPADLAACLIRVLSNPDLRIRLVRRARDWAEYHDWNRVAADIEAYYLELLEAQSTRR
ncbi:MAG: glycosyltransferase family 4 protein [candidate division WOR-3 bacterium]